MAKVKMNEIKSGSENVKEVFRKSMISRTKKWLETKTFTDDELQEILHLCEYNEQHKKRSEFYDKLVLSQTNFSNKVFEFLVGKLSDADALLHLLQNSSNNSDEHKVSWLINVVKISSKLTNDFVLSGDSKSQGIDIESPPINYLFARELILKQETIYDDFVPTYYLNVLYKTVTSLNRDEFSKWFKNTKSYHKNLSRLLLMNKDMHENMLIDLFNLHDGDDWNRHWIVKHQNCPEELKMEMYEKTGDDSILPQQVQDIFIF